jgi:16S rRNA processing protein RimM
VRKPKRPRHKAQNAPDYEGFTWIGTIVNVHGIQGELKIQPHTDTPQYYLEVERLFMEDAEKLVPCQVEQIRFHKNHWIVRFAQIGERNQAELFCKHRVFLEDSKLRPLDAGEFFVHDLIGCRVVDLAGASLGEVSRVLQTGANDVYCVAREAREFLVPAVPHIVIKVDLVGKLIQIDPIPGLID